MRKFLFVTLLFAYCSLFGQKQAFQVKQSYYADTLHGVVIPDPYKWMEDLNSDELLKYVKAENKYTKKANKKTKHLQKKIHKEFEQRKIISLPPEELYDKPDGDYIYFSRKIFKGYVTKYGRRLRDNPNDEEIFLEALKYVGQNEFELISYKLSPNERYIAYTTLNKNENDRRTYIAGLKDYNPNTTEFLQSDLVDWLDDNTLIYKQMQGGYKMHKLGTQQNTDNLIFEQTDKSFESKLSISNSKEYIFMEFFNMHGSEIYYINLKTSDDLKIFAPFEKGIHYEVFHDTNDTVFYIKTNLNAPNFKISTTSLTQTESKYWKDILPESDNLIQWVESSTGDYIVLSEYGNGSVALSVLEKRTGNKYLIKFDEVAHDMSFMHIDTLKNTIRFRYGSFITQEIIYDYDIETKQLTKLFETQISNYNKSDYTVEVINIPAHDGKQIPTIILYNKNTPRDGTASVRLSGDFVTERGIAEYPIPNLQTYYWLDKGFYAVYASQRGGGLPFSQRAKDGTLENTKNGAYDFASVAQYLIDEKYTSEGRIHAIGSDENGLLVGMTANMYPKLFGSITLINPYLDVLFETDENIWRTRGNPNIKEEFEYMLDCSPYQNVKKQAYPTMLFEIGLKDKVVPAYQAIKMAAKIKAYNTGNNPVYLRTDLLGDHHELYQKGVCRCVIWYRMHYNILPK